MNVRTEVDMKTVAEYRDTDDEGSMWSKLVVESYKDDNTLIVLTTPNGMKYTVVAREVEIAVANAKAASGR